MRKAKSQECLEEQIISDVGRRGTHFDGNGANWDYELYRTYFDWLENLFLALSKGPGLVFEVTDDRVLMLYFTLRTPSASKVLVFPGLCESPRMEGEAQSTPQRSGQG